MYTAGPINYQVWYPVINKCTSKNTKNKKKQAELTTSRKNSSRPILSKGLVMVAISQRIMAKPAPARKRGYRAQHRADIMYQVSMHSTCTPAGITTHLIPRCLLLLLCQCVPSASPSM